MNKLTVNSRRNQAVLGELLSIFPTLEKREEDIEGKNVTGYTISFGLSL